MVAHVSNVCKTCVVRGNHTPLYAAYHTNNMLVVWSRRVIVGTLYPAYNSFKILETPFTPAKGSTAEEKRPRYWLTYWTVYGLWNIVESLSDTVFSAIPFYYQVKIAFFLWMQLPQFGGAKILYHKFIAPFLRQHEVNSCIAKPPHQH